MKKQHLTGLIPLAGVAAVLLSLPLLARLPGIAGETFLKILGFATTPFFMEAGLALLGIIALLAVNSYTRNRDGDEFVELEISENSNDSETNS